MYLYLYITTGQCEDRERIIGTHGKKHWKIIPKELEDVCKTDQSDNNISETENNINNYITLKLLKFNNLLVSNYSCVRYVVMITSDYQ